LVLFAKWNGVYNLSAIRDAQGMMVQHLLDSLSVVPYFVEYGNSVDLSCGAMSVLDVGSGGGLPGIPLAICCPTFQVSLVDAVEKKTAFLRQVKAQLMLDNLTVYHDRVEHLTGKFDVVTSRAFAELVDFVNCSGAVLKPDGRFYAMKGIYPEAEIGRLPKEFEVERTIELYVPNLDAQRHLIVIKQKKCDV
jgi:16S rRNA (guanine527-N7)-methyltransferase